MSQLACKYHYDLPARWMCRSCRINFCTNCIPSLSETETPHCAICSDKLTVVGAENVVAPFWQRLHHYFMYPINPVPAGLIILLTVAIAALGHTLFGVVAVSLSLLVYMKYAYVVLDDTSHGYILPRAFSFDMLSKDLELPFKQLLNLFLIIALNYLVYDYSERYQIKYLFESVLSLTVFFLPASIMVLAVKRSFTGAFNPMLYFHLVKNIGLPYILLFVFILMMLSSAIASIYYIQPLIPDSFKLATYSFVLMYFLLGMFNMLGYVLYQYHEKIGFGVDIEVSSSHGDEKDVEHYQLRMPAMIDIEILVQEGEYKKALNKLEARIKNEPSDMHARTYYQKLLHLLGDTEGARQHCADFVGRLLAEKKMTLAIKVFSACYKEDPQVNLTKPTQRLELAKLCINDSQYRLAMHLLNNLHRDHPSYADIPKAYFLVAKMMSEQFNQDKKAIGILQFTIEHYPQYKDINELKKLLQILKSVTESEALN